MRDLTAFDGDFTDAPEVFFTNVGVLKSSPVDSINDYSVNEWLL